ncbi:MAG: peptidase M14 [Acidobacteria bacterium]|nr:MAG: peptidase M14 [Acidobacteriota bacterium]
MVQLNWRRYAFFPLLLLFVQFPTAPVSGISSPSSRSVVQTHVIPRPEDVFGFKPGTDYRLADYNQMLAYYRRLDEASDRIKVFEIGPTCEGRQMILAVISAEANMANLEKWRQTSEKLARAQVSEQEARDLARTGKAVVWIDGGLHANEVGHAQHSPELAYRLVTDETASAQQIRNNVILLQVPVLNPDGLDLVANWYKSNLGTRYETSPLPELYHKYAGHDNNRDWYMMTQPETRNASVLLYQKWFPQIVLNHHQTPPFPARIFIPPFTSPVNPNIPKPVLNGIDQVGQAMAGRFEKEGKAGVVSRMEFDAWWNGGMRTTPCFHNMIGILAETALYAYATPYDYKRENLPRRFHNGLPALVSSPDYPNPWLGGPWKLSNAIDYMLTASMSVLDVAAKQREAFLYNIYRMGREAIDEGKRGAPSAYVIPVEGQHDPSAAVGMVQVLKLGGLDIEQAEEAFEAAGRHFAKGTYIIPTAQAFRPYLVDLMEVQKYPGKQTGDESEQPYDLTGWTLPMQMGVKTFKVERELTVSTRSVLDVELPEVESFEPYKYYLIDRRWNTSFTLVNRLLNAGIEVEVLRDKLVLEDSEIPPGCFLVSGQQGETVHKFAAELRIPLRGVDAPPTTRAERLVKPRVALYKPSRANQDEGWIRWLLERYEFSFECLREDSIRRADLHRLFDVIIIPSEPGNRLIEGPTTSLLPPQFSIGIGAEGLHNLKEFVQQGGVLIASDATCQVPLDYFGVPFRNAVRNLSESVFSCPGSLVRLEVDDSDPVGWGMDREVAACFVKSQAFELLPGAEQQDTTSVARYAKSDVLMSGWIRGEEQLRGKSAVGRARVGRGEVVLLGFPAHFRGQPHGTFKLLFNSIYLAGLRDNATAYSD